MMAVNKSNKEYSLFGNHRKPVGSRGKRERIARPPLVTGDDSFQQSLAETRREKVIVVTVFVGEVAALLIGEVLVGSSDITRV